MALNHNRFYSPDQQFLSNSGVPYAGGFLYFYATGTSTPQNTYSDQGLTIANTNPVVLDSNGQAGSIFLLNLAYKVVLEDSNHNQIWTMDPVYTSDYSTFAQLQPWNGNPNGFVPGFAGSIGALPGTSVVWDYVDDVLYVCTVGGIASTAVWTAINAPSQTSTITPTPQGYLTLSSDPSNPILTTDAVSQTSVYYTPYVGSLIPVYNGTSFITTSFTQLVLTLSASQALNTIYDCFVFSNSGVLTLVTGPAWSSSAAGSGVRGTGASTSQLQRLNGLWVNAVQITGINGSSTFTVGANKATYVGSIYIDGTAGQITCDLSWGQSRKWGVFNTYNRVPIVMQAGDSTSSWSYSTNTWRASNANSANSLTVFQGLAEEAMDLRFVQSIAMSLNNAGGNSEMFTGIGLNSTTAPSGKQGRAQGLGANNNSGSDNTAVLLQPPLLGINVISALENTTAFSGTFTYFGTSASMLLSAQYRG